MLRSLRNLDEASFAVQAADKETVLSIPATAYKVDMRVEDTFLRGPEHRNERLRQVLVAEYVISLRFRIDTSSPNLHGFRVRFRV